MSGKKGKVRINFPLLIFREDSTFFDANGGKGKNRTLREKEEVSICSTVWRKGKTHHN